MHRLCWFLIAAVLMVVTAPSKAKAEYCWMIGCGDQIGYVFIPSTQYLDHGIYEEGEFLRVKRGGMTYKIFGDRPVFRKFGLPSPGTTVVLNVQRGLLSPDEIKKNIANFSGGPFVPSIIGKQNLNFYNPMYHGKTPPADGPGFPMRSGTKLKILDYRTFGGDVAGGIPLFALVLVLEDG